MTTPVSILIALLLALGSASALAQDCHARTWPSTPTDKFRDNGDGTVTDARTRLTWMRCPLGMHWTGDTCQDVAVSYEWQEAQRRVRRFNEAGGFAGRTDWRLPTLAELEKIVEHRCIDPAINPELFPATPSTGFWTATRDADYDKGAWLVYFLHGESYMGNVQQAWALRLVHD